MGGGLALLCLPLLPRPFLHLPCQTLTPPLGRSVLLGCRGSDVGATHEKTSLSEAGPYRAAVPSRAFWLIFTAMASHAL